MDSIIRLVFNNEGGKIVEILGISWGTAGLIMNYLGLNVWWEWVIDAGFLVAGIVSGGVAALMKQAATVL